MFSLLEEVLDRFERESGGHLLVATLCLLEVSSGGLQESELLDILANEDDLVPPSPFEEKGKLIGVIFTDRVRSTREGYVLTRVCPSVCQSTPSGGGGYPSQVQLGEGGYPCRGVPHLRYPLVRPGQGVPC